MNSEGKKMGKTANGAVWLDAKKTSPYEFFQYWRNVDDADVIKCMKMLTFLPLEEIAEYEKLEGSELNKAKEKLAFELTELVHGKEHADASLASARALFGGGGDRENMPATEICDEDFVDGKIALANLLVKCELCPSTSEAKRLIKQGGVSVNDEKIADLSQSYDKAFFADEVIIKKGKKVYHKVTLG